MSENIKVCIRVRPFNKNEKGQTSILQVNDKILNLIKPEGLNDKKQQVRNFQFHRCYWSVDGSQGKPPVNNMFIFNDIGKQILNQIYQGFNATIFAYGQTGSGKSYSIEGRQPDQKGILQLCLEDIFKRKQQNKNKQIKTKVEVQYIQIYNEKLRDLINPNSKDLKIFRDKSEKVSIINADPLLCESYDDAISIFKEGKQIRVCGSTNMNQTSSRSHSIFTIIYSQQLDNITKVSKFNIVDLAGSQRQGKTQAEGDRFVQGIKINLSLSLLAKLINDIHEKQKKGKKVSLNYRNSKLNYLLSQSLGGNSKTFMIAALSPASSNYNQTKYTLQFAKRVSGIESQTKINIQTKMDLIKNYDLQINELKEKYDKLLLKYNQSKAKQNQEDLENLRKQINFLNSKCQKYKQLQQGAKNQLEMQRKRVKYLQQERHKYLKSSGIRVSKIKQNVDDPYLLNIEDDPSLTGLLTYCLKQGQTRIGNYDGIDNNIKLGSIDVMVNHCIITRNGNQISIQPEFDSLVGVNGCKITQKKKINHLDKIYIGNNNTFKLVIPGQKQNIYKSQNTEQKADNQYLFSTNIQLKHLQKNLSIDNLAKFTRKFKQALKDVASANGYTMFRYRKFPLRSNNIQFRLKMVTNIQNYSKDEPLLIVVCQHKESKEIEFIWSQQKFYKRLKNMESWFQDVKIYSISKSTFYEFDPWFDASDQFIRQKQELQLMNNQEVIIYWQKKHAQISNYFLKIQEQQRQITQELQRLEVKDMDLIQKYGDLYIRGQQTPDIQKKNIQQCIKMRKNQQIHKFIKRFVQCCSQIYKAKFNAQKISKEWEKYKSIENNDSQKTTCQKSRSN